MAGPAISVIVPVHNGASVLPSCLAALQRSRQIEWECIVVDDASTDGSSQLAKDAGATVLHTGRRAGRSHRAPQPEGPRAARSVTSSAI